MAGYFSYFPKVYVGEGISDDENFKYRLVKNIFRRVKSREDLAQYSTLFEAYSIRDGETPESLARKFFAEGTLDWVILLINNVIDPYDDWPKRDNDLFEFILEKYGDTDAVHHYETQEARLSDGSVYMPEGVEVNVDYRTILPDGTTLSAEDSRIPITNYEHEQLENEKKRQILIPTPTMLDKIIEEFETLVRYLPHPELDKKGNKKTPLNIAAKFLDNIASAQGSISVIEFSAAGTGATSFDYGPSSSGGATAGVVTGSGGTAVASTTTTPVGVSTSTSPSPSPSPLAFSKSFTKSLTFTFT